jgi:hypothetical protein
VYRTCISDTECIFHNRMVDVSETLVHWRDLMREVLSTSAAIRYPCRCVTTVPMRGVSPDFIYNASLHPSGGVSTNGRGLGLGFLVLFFAPPFFAPSARCYHHLELCGIRMFLSRVAQAKLTSSSRVSRWIARRVALLKRCALRSFAGYGRGVSIRCASPVFGRRASDRTWNESMNQYHRACM